MHERPANWMGVLAGAVAAATMGAAMLALRMAAGIPAYPELIGAALGARVPIDLFNLSTGAFGTQTKPALFVLLTAIMVGVGALLGLLYVRRLWRPGPPADGALLPALGVGGAAWLIVMFVLSPLVGAGVFGIALPGGGAAYLLGGLFLFGLYAVALAAMTALLRRAFVASATAGAPDEQRRALLRAVATGGTLVAVGALAVQVRRFAFGHGPGGAPATPTAAERQAQVIAQTARAQAQANAATLAGTPADLIFEGVRDKLPAEVTDADRFYVISKNFVDPVINESGWRMKIGGLVARPATLALADLRALPSVTLLRTMECISNRIAGDLIGNAQWTGVPLRMVLMQASVQPEAVTVQFTCEDGYTTAIPLAAALDADTILAYAMNGAPLSPRHGFPARLIIPARYGMKNPKWITAIAPTAEQYQGFWERQGWSDTAIVQTMSRIDTPARGDAPRAGVEVGIGGVAYAGARGIRRVEWSADGGTTWQEAALLPPLGPYTWVFWAARWTPTRPGAHTLTVRATDGEGALQTAASQPPIPDGATGYHRVPITVRG